MLNVIYEDNQILVVIKPQNIPTQADSSNDKDLLTMCKEYIKEKYNKPGEVYLGMVHRLDRPTGGIVCFARTSKAANRLCEAIKNGEFKKTYLTVVNGRPKNNEDRLVHYLKKDTINNMVSIATSTEEGSKEAILDYKVLNNSDKKSLLNIELETGRGHQIRVQMKSMNTPVVGDRKYGDQNQKGFLALWAYKLEFIHPTTKNIMKFICLPDIEKEPWNLFKTDINNLANIR